MRPAPTSAGFLLFMSLRSKAVQFFAFSDILKARLGPARHASRPRRLNSLLIPCANEVAFGPAPEGRLRVPWCDSGGLAGDARETFRLACIVSPRCASNLLQNSSR